jgi:predicted CoA-binding protein
MEAELTQQAMQFTLLHCRTVAVVGLSPKPHRDSYKVSQYMQRKGWRIIPVNPQAAGQDGGEILGEKVYSSLLEAAQHEAIDLVNVFRNSVDVPPIVDDAIAIGAKAIWLQMGITHAAAAAKARARGLQVVQDKCLMVEHARHG